MNPIRGLNFRELWTFAAGVSGFALHSRTAHIESSQSDVGASEFAWLAEACLQ